MKTSLIVIFSLMCIIQWYVPAAMIVGQENILRSGKLFRFKTAPVDPSDPFRGKYITLNFEASEYKTSTGEQWPRGQEVFVILQEDSGGFARVAGLSTSLPESGKDYVEARVLYSDDESVRLEYPFERFYLAESKAGDAEKAYWQANSNDSSQTAYALVRTKNGKSSLENVMINGRGIADIIRELNAH